MSKHQVFVIKSCSFRMKSNNNTGLQWIIIRIQRMLKIGNEMISLTATQMWYKFCLCNIKKRILIKKTKYYLSTYS